MTSKYHLKTNLRMKLICFNDETEIQVTVVYMQ